MQPNWKSALVTGASRGIGRGIALKLVEVGVPNIGINYLSNDEAAKETVDQVKAAGAEAVLFKADVTDLDQIKGMFEKARSA